MLLITKYGGFDGFVLMMNKKIFDTKNGKKYALILGTYEIGHCKSGSNIRRTKITRELIRF